MKTFMALWAVISRFKSLLSYWILVLIPIVNVVSTWRYAGKRLDRSKDLFYRMAENLKTGLPAFDKETRQIWRTTVAEIMIVLILTRTSVWVNNYAMDTWLDPSWPVNFGYLRWFEIAAWGISGALIISCIIRSLNAIYNAHRSFDPEYMDSPSERYLSDRNAHISARKAKEGSQTESGAPSA